jgi:hypothetical protein
MIKLTLRVKFRAFFVDLFKIERVFDVELIPYAVPLPHFSQVLMDERGVYLKIEAE